jgi:hypothetical protein
MRRQSRVAQTWKQKRPGIGVQCFEPTCRECQTEQRLCITSNWFSIGLRDIAFVVVSALVTAVTAVFLLISVEMDIILHVTGSRY